MRPLIGPVNRGLDPKAQKSLLGPLAFVLAVSATREHSEQIQHPKPLNEDHDCHAKQDKEFHVALVRYC